MAKSSKSSELKQDNDINVGNENYNPFFESVIEKPYSQVNVNTSRHQVENNIDEPIYNPQSLDTEYNPYKDLDGDEHEEPRQSNVNPALDELSEAEKEASAKQMAEMTIDAYKQAHVFANTMLQFPSRKLKKLENDGDIDLSIPIPYELGKTITANEFINEFNEQNKDALFVDKEFEKQVKPPLARVFKKKGIGLSDEQTLIYLFSKDIILKGVMVAQIRGTMNQFIDNLKETTQAYKSGNFKQENSTPKQPQYSTQEAPKRSTNSDVKQPENINSDTYNFEENEAVLNSTVTKMKMPTSGKDRLMKQKQKEKVWESNTPSSYKDVLNSKKDNVGSSKRGRPKKNFESVDIADAIVIKETENYSENIENLD